MNDLLNDHPAPEIPARLATDDELPRSARSLLDTARAAYWTGHATYARGTWMDGHGNPSRVVDTIRVHLRSPGYGLGALAAWNDGKFLYAYIWSRWSQPRKIGARELKTFVGLNLTTTPAAVVVSGTESKESDR